MTPHAAGDGYSDLEPRRRPATTSELHESVPYLAQHEPHQSTTSALNRCALPALVYNENLNQPLCAVKTKFEQEKVSQIASCLNLSSDARAPTALAQKFRTRSRRRLVHPLAIREPATRP